MSTLAHEGNPKEDSITISGGSVLSTAQLDINFDFFGGINPTWSDPGVPPNVPAFCAGVEEIREVEQCGLGLQIIDRYDLGSYAATTKLHGSFVGCSGDPAGGFVFQPTTPFFDIDVLSGRHDLTTETQGNFAGFSIVEGVINASHLGDTLSAYAQYDVIYGEPIVGFCFWVDIESTTCNFTGMVAINDVASNQSYLGYFVNADLHSDSATVLATGTLCPTNQIFSFYNDLSSSTFELSKTSGLLLSSSDVGTIVPSVIDNNPNWGIIWLPNTSSVAMVHQAKFAYGSVAWDIA